MGNESKGKLVQVRVKGKSRKKGWKGRRRGCPSSRDGKEIDGGPLGS